MGKSTWGMKRPMVHSRPSVFGRDRTYRSCWIKSLAAEGLKPEIEVLEVHESAEALVEAEQHFIAYFRFLGCRLTNLTVGGEGIPGFRHTTETRLRMSNVHLRENLTPETLARMSAAQVGKRLSLEHRASLARAALLRPPLSSETRQKISEASRGRVPWSVGATFSDDMKLRMSRAKGGRRIVDESGVVYLGASDAAKRLGLSPGGVSRAAKTGGRAGAHTFRYAE